MVRRSSVRVTRVRFLVLGLATTTLLIVSLQLVGHQQVTSMIRLRIGAGAGTDCPSSSSCSPDGLTTTTTRASSKDDHVVVLDPTSVRHVLKPSLHFLAHALDTNQFHNNLWSSSSSSSSSSQGNILFPPITMVHHSHQDGYECPHKRLREKWRLEFLQEVGFIQFLTYHYPFTQHYYYYHHHDHNTTTTTPTTTTTTTTSSHVHWKGAQTILSHAKEQGEQQADKATTPTASSVTVNAIPQSPNMRYFLPMCPMMQGIFGKHGKNDKPSAWSKVIPTLNQTAEVMEEVLQPVTQHGKRVFFVAAHPMASQLPWEHVLHNARALRIDQTSLGFYNDIMIPISHSIRTCNYTLWDNDDDDNEDAQRTTLLYGCGREHSQRYKGYRQRLFDNIRRHAKALVADANNRYSSSDGDDHAASSSIVIDVSTERTREEYREGFGKAKFCLVTPGDTTASSQQTRAMCQGCVPIFMAHDMRELPLANILDYSSFSWRWRPDHNQDLLYRPDEAVPQLIQTLQEMVQNGTYAKLRANVRIARDFFNYHRFTARSPYGAALISMWQDEQNEWV